MKFQNMLILAIILSIITVSAYAQTKVVAVSGVVTNNSIQAEQKVTDAGFSFRPLQSWKYAIKENKKAILWIDAPSKKVKTGITLYMEDANTLGVPTGSDVGRVFDLLYRSVGTQEPVKQPIKVAQQEGYKANFSTKNLQNSGTPASGILAVVSVENKFLIILGLDPSNGWTYEKEFNSVLSSIGFQQGKALGNSPKIDSKKTVENESPKPKKRNPLKRVIEEVKEEIKKLTKPN